MKLPAVSWHVLPKVQPQARGQPILRASVPGPGNMPGPRNGFDLRKAIKKVGAPIPRRRSRFNPFRIFEPKRLTLEEVPEEHALAFFLHSPDIAPGLRRIVRAAQTDGAFILAQQMNMAAHLGGSLDPRNFSVRKNTLSCFIGRGGRDQEFFLILKRLMMNNHWLAWMMYQEHLVFDLRKIDDPEHPEVKIYLDHGGLAPRSVFVPGITPVHDTVAQRINFVQVIMKEILPKARERFRRHEFESKRSEEHLKVAKRHIIFRNYAKGKGLAYLTTVEMMPRQKSWKFQLFLRGFTDGERVSRDFINRLAQSPVRGLSHVEDIALVLVQNQLTVVINSKLNGGQMAQMRQAIFAIVDKILTQRVVSDTHFGDHGWNADKVARHVHFLQHAAGEGYSVGYDGDIFEGWRKRLDQILMDPLYAPIWKAMRKIPSLHFIIGNHDYTIAKRKALLPRLKRLLHDVTLEIVSPDGVLRVGLDEVRLLRNGQEIDQESLEFIETEHGLFMNAEDFQSGVTVELKKDRFVTRARPQHRGVTFTIKKVRYGDRVRVSDSASFAAGFYLSHGNIGDGPYNYGPGINSGFTMANRADELMQYGFSEEKLERWAMRAKSLWQPTIFYERKILQQLIEARRLFRDLDHQLAFLNGKNSPVDLRFALPEEERAAYRFGVMKALDEVCGSVHELFGHVHEDDYLELQNEILRRSAQLLGQKTIPQMHQLMAWVKRPRRFYVEEVQKVEENYQEEWVTTCRAISIVGRPMIERENYYVTYIRPALLTVLMQRAKELNVPPMPDA